MGLWITWLCFCLQITVSLEQRNLAQFRWLANSLLIVGIHSPTHTQIDTHRHTHTQIDTHTDTLPHRSTHTQTHSHTDRHSHRQYKVITKHQTKATSTKHGKERKTKRHKETNVGTKINIAGQRNIKFSCRFSRQEWLLAQYWHAVSLSALLFINETIETAGSKWQ